MALIFSLSLAGVAAAQEGNTRLGTGALQNNTTGDLNTAVGANALRSNTTGTGNTASGANALRPNITGNDNTASGANALRRNTTGNDNTASGVHALARNTTGSFNTAVGVEALFSNTTGFFNTAIGWDALFNNTEGHTNIANGVFSLFNNTTGVANIAIGTNALFDNIRGNFNVATGSNALGSNISGLNNIASGQNALFGNTTGNDNIGIGPNSLTGNTTGRDNIAVGHETLVNNTIGNSNTGIGAFADVSVGNLTNATALGFQAIVNNSNKVRLGNAAVTVIEGQVAFTAVSDRTQKENFQPVDGEEVLGKIRSFELSSWNFIGHDPKKFRHYGPMAQDFFAAFGHDGVGQIGTETTINSGDLAGILMIAVQALEKRTAELKQTKAQLAAMAERLEALELGTNHPIQTAEKTTPTSSEEHNARTR
jgi:hypothetical protein